MEQDKGNPENTSNKPSDNNEAQGKVFGSSTEFFSQLESNVNGAIDDSLLDTYDSPPKNEPGNESPVNVGPQQVTPQTTQGNSSSIDWEKRYKSSSNEARKLNDKVKELTKFEPLLKVMRKDKGLVTHIKEYLENGGSTKTLKEKLDIPEDYVYDQQEALEDPKSNSAKLFNAKVDEAVNSKVGELQRKTQIAGTNATAKANLIRSARDLQSKFKLNDEQVKAVVKSAAKKRITLDDAYYLLNRENAGQKMANNTRKDMMQQMQNARNIPQSASHSNSAQVDKNPTDDLFDALKGSDEADNLFG